MSEGWYISRAERKPNLLYQGLAVQCYTGNINQPEADYPVGTDPDDMERSEGWPDNFDTTGNDENFYQENKWVPLVNGKSWNFFANGSNEGQSRFYYGNPQETNSNSPLNPPYEEHQA